MVDLTNAQIRSVIKREAGNPVGAYARICLAQRLGTGVNLSAEEVQGLAIDHAVYTAVEEAHFEQWRQESPK